jgi:hypothetical protein
MKNIFVLPSRQTPIKGDLLLRHIWKKHPQYECISWWRYKETITIENVIQYTTLNGSFRDMVSSFEVQNLYVTNDEEIKEGWVWHLGRGHLLKVGQFTEINGNKGFRDAEFNINGIEVLVRDCRKVVLTTDRDLIKDRVQAISDDFLGSFVDKANDSGKPIDIVEVEKYCPYPKCNCDLGVCGNGINQKKYKPIISQQPKQETIEEETLSKIKFVLLANNDAQAIRILEQYAEFQKEKSYSEEDMKNFAWFLIENVGQYSCDRTAHFEGKYLEQFKNK